MKKIAIMANKGGTMKTTLITNYAVHLSRQGHKVLLIDLDSQANATITFGIESPYSIYDIYLKNKKTNEVIQTVGDGLDILPANKEIANFIFHLDEKEIFNLLAFTNKLNYDFILFDTPPSLEIIAHNVLKVSDGILIPFVPEIYSVGSLMNVIDVIRQVQTKRKIKILGVVPVMVDGRIRVHREVLAMARVYCYEQQINFFETYISRTVQYVNSIAYNSKPLLMTKKTPKTETLEKLFSEIGGEL